MPWFFNHPTLMPIYTAKVVLGKTKVQEPSPPHLKEYVLISIYVNCDLRIRAGRMRQFAIPVFFTGSFYMQFLRG